MSKKVGYYSNIFTAINNAFLKNKFLRKIKSIYYLIDGILLFLFTKKPKKEENSRKKVVIAYNLSLGDGVMFMTALKNLRKIYPKDKYEITLYCHKGLNKMYEKLDIFDYVIAVDFTGSTVNIKNRIKTLKQLRSNYYDIALDPIGIEECTMNILMNRAICADEKIGIINKAVEINCPKRIYNKVYTKIIEINDNKKHLLEQYNDFFNEIGNEKNKIEFVNLPDEKVKEKLPEKYFIVYPSASTEYKKWPVDRFAEITKKIYDKLKIQVVLCGTEEDRKTNEELKQLLPNIPIIDLTSKTSILEFINLVKNAYLVICNDTGIYHIATISQTPVAIMSGGYTYYKYLLYNFKGNENFKKPCVVSENMECFNCGNRCIYYKDMQKTWPCLDKITVEMAWEKINKMIEKIGVSEESNIWN